MLNFNKPSTTIGILCIIAIVAWGCSSDSPVYTLEVSPTPIEGGTVLPASGEYDEGETIEVRATANENWVFVSWQGDVTGSNNPITVTMDSDKIFTALFELREYPLDIITEGEGTVQESIIAQKQPDYDAGTYRMEWRFGGK